MLIEKAEQDPELTEIIDNSDLTVGNLETLFHNMHGYPEVYDGQGSPMHSDPSNIDILREFKLNLIGHSNNHSNDYGILGLLESINHLTSQGIKHSGVGINFEEASNPAITRVNGLKVGLISSASTYTRWAIATKSNSRVPGRPGINVIDVSPNYLFYLSKVFRLFARKFFNPKIERILVFGDYKIKDIELQKVKDQIKNARSKADLVFYSYHSHQGSPERPMSFQKRLARFCIDHGVDVFFSHGSHELRGIEIYKKKPIFYGLGNFIAQSHLIKRYPSDFLLLKGINPEDDIVEINQKLSKVIMNRTSWWESIAVKIIFENKVIKLIELIPINLKGSQNIGFPYVAKNHSSTRILKKIKSLSKSFGTKIKILNDKAIIEI